MIEFLIRLIKFTILMLIVNYLFIGMDFNKALFVAIGAYSTPPLIDYIYIKIKNKLIKHK